MRHLGGLTKERDLERERKRGLAMKSPEVIYI